MENSGDKSVTENGFEFGSNLSNSKDSCSSPAPLGWPIKKAQIMNKSNDVSEDKSKSKINFDCESKIKKLGTTISGKLYLFNFFFINFNLIRWENFEFCHFFVCSTLCLFVNNLNLKYDGIIIDTYKINVLE